MSLCISAHWRICSPNIEGRPDFLWTIVMMIGHCLKKSWRCLGKKSDCGKSLIRSLTYRELWTDASGSSWPELARLVSGPPGLSRILVGRPSFSMKLFSRWWLILPGPPRPPLPENKIFISVSFQWRWGIRSYLILLKNGFHQEITINIFERY